MRDITDLLGLLFHLSILLIGIGAIVWALLFAPF